MSIEKIKGGHYRITKMYKGVRYRVIVDHKPSAKEQMELILNEINKKPKICNNITFDEACDAYLESSNNILSISTIKGYASLQKRIRESISPTFSKTKVNEIDQVTIQRLINTYSKKHAPKTVKNLNAFISAVLKFVDPQLSFDIKLPPKRISETYIPEDNDVKAILEELEGTEYEVPIMLATFGLRRSEICALDISDFNFKNNSVYVHKAKLQDKDNKWVIVERNKSPKSTRTVYIPDIVCNAVKEKGYVFNGYPGAITMRIQAIQKKLGLEKFPLHKLRHYFASMSHSQGIPEAYILEQGGWSSPNVMKAVYRHAQTEQREKMAQLAISHVKSVINSDKA